MDELMKIQNSNKITSLEILEQINLFREEESNKKELRHDTLLGIIRDEFEEEISLQKILESKYTNSRGKQYPMFELTLNQAKQILVRESKYVRKAVIQYIETLENKLKSQQSKLPTTYKEALIALVEQVEMNERLLEENGIQKQQLTEYEPKVTYYEQILNSNGLINISIIAKDYGKSAVWLNQYLHDKKVQYKQGNTWLLYSKHQNKGYTKSKTYFDERNNTTRINTKWTQAGRLFLYDLLKGDNILPLIEQEN